MANHRKPDDVKVVALCASVTKPVKETILNAAREKGVSVASFVGMILEEWVSNHIDGMVRNGETRDISIMGKWDSQD